MTCMTPPGPRRLAATGRELQVCAEVIEPAFRKADGAALRHQSYHRQLVKLATVFGTAAIIFAILQLAFGDAIGLHDVAFAELVAVGLALIAFVLGSLVAFQLRWLVERNKAERLRMAKFRYLIDPELWGGDPATEARKRGRARKRSEADRGHPAQGRT